MKSITKTLLEIEDRARLHFEKTPFLQALLAGIGVIIFWRGIWEWLDVQKISPVVSVMIGSLILLSVGVFVQTFIGNTIIIKNVKQEEQLEKKAIKEMESEVDTEEVTLASLSAKLDSLLQKIDDKK
ncbi:MAG: hypothetical protein WCO65_00665 [bacterium]